MLRQLLGSAKEIDHDPGAEGESGEGDSVIVKFCLMYLITAAVLIYEKFIKKETESAADEAKGKIEAAKQEMKNKADVEGGEANKAVEELSEEDLVDKIAQDRWTEDSGDQMSEENRRTFVKILSCGTVDYDNRGAFGNILYQLSVFNWVKFGQCLFVLYALWVFLLSLSVMGTGFKLLGGKSSAKMFDVVDNPISALMVGVLATVLVQSSSTSTSIIISLVGANELSVRIAIFMVMGANIGTSVTNTIVSLGYFASKNDLRRGFAAATVHDLFNWLSVLVLLPLNWMYPFLEKMTYEMAKSQKPCDEDAGDNCVKQEFLKPYISPYSKAVASYDKKVASYVSQGYCSGQCTSSLSTEQLTKATDLLCKKTDSGDHDCGALPGFEGSWMSKGLLYKKRVPAYALTGDDASAPAQFLHTVVDSSNAKDLFADDAGAVAPNTLYKVCPSYKTGLCDKRLLKGGLMLEDWELSDDAAGTTATILSLLSLCCCLFLIVYSLQRIVRGPAARILRRVVGFNGYFSIAIGCVITILVQSSSITTSTLTPLCAVGLIPLEDMFPLTLGANIGTTLTGIMAATVVASNPVEAWQVALCHFFFNIFGILIWYPVPKLRQVPLNGARFLGKMTARFGPPFPLAYTFVVFFIFPAIVYGITVAAQS